MSSNRARLFSSALSAIILFSMVVSMIAPLGSLSNVFAQEDTEEPPVETLPADETPAGDSAETPAPPAPTDEAPPTPESTPAPIPEAQTPTPELLPIIIELPVFEDDFEDANPAAWVLSEGWSLAAELDGNTVLTTTGDFETAVVAGLLWEHLEISARVAIDEGNTANIAFRVGADNYNVTVNATGQASLYQGLTLLATGLQVIADEPLPEVTGEPLPALDPVWHDVSVQAYGNMITVIVNGEPQISLIAADPLPAGAVILSTGAANTGRVSFDDIVIRQLPAPSAPQPTPQPIIILPDPTGTDAPEATDEPVIEEPETTEEPAVDEPEATEEPAVDEPEATDEPAPEATEEPVTEEDDALAPFLTADFEGETQPGWVLSEGASIFNDGLNGVGILTPAASLTPEQTLFLTGVRVDARVNLAGGAEESAPAALSMYLHNADDGAYVVIFDAASTALYRASSSALELLASAAAERSLSTWYALSVEVNNGQVSVTVNDSVELVYVDETPITGGSIGFAASGGADVLLDDIAVFDLSVAVDTTATAVPYTLTDENRVKLGGALSGILQTYLDGDEEGAANRARDFFLTVDEYNRVNVAIWGADGQTSETIAALVQSAGGQVTDVYASYVQAFVSFDAMLLLVSMDEIAAIYIPETAVSTAVATSEPQSVPEATAQQGGGTIKPHSLDLLGVNSWHQAGATGSGIKIAVIDTGFVGVTAGGERGCLTSATPIGGTGSSSHGVNVVEVICDIAPNSQVTMYTANNTSDLATRIGTAVANGEHLIVITIDTGISGGAGTIDSAIQNAHNNGIPVIASAGNTGETGSGAFAFSGGTGTFEFSASAGSIISYGWQEPDGPVNYPSMLYIGPDLIDSRPTRVGGPSHQYTVPASCGEACVVTLIIDGYDAAVIQVQINGSTGNEEILSGQGFFPMAASSLTTAANSQYAIAVGAVCASQNMDEERYPILASSSRGDSSQTNATGANIKPEIVSLAFVRTSVPGNNIEPYCEVNNVGGFNQVTDGDGFGGTSAAAAHVAGMSALLLSNYNNISMSTHFSTQRPQRLEAYLMTRVIDLRQNGINADNGSGFDHWYGAGLAVLGNPNFNMDQQVNYSANADPDGPLGPLPPLNGGGGGNAVYVGTANIFSAQDGTPANPYIHPGLAIRRAISQGRTYVVFQPGEYVSSFQVPDPTGANSLTLIGYDAADSVNLLPSNFWVNDTYLGTGGGIFINAVQNVTVEGFDFTGSTPLYDEGLGVSLPERLQLQPVAPMTISNSTGITVRNNTFTNFDAALIVSGSDNVIIERNTFDSFVVPSTLQPVFGTPVPVPFRRVAALDIDNSGAVNGVLVYLNAFRNSHIDHDPSSRWQETILGIRRSRVSANNNRFENNFGGSMIAINQFIDPTNEPISPILGTDVANYPVTIYSSLFDSNTLIGPLIHLYQGPTFTFVNNTVANHSLLNDSPTVGSGGIFGGVVAIGHSNTVFTQISNHRWEFHNNLFFNTRAAPQGGLIFVTGNDTLGADGCLRHGVATGGTKNAAQYNWFIAEFAGFNNSNLTNGECSVSTGTPGTPANNNQFTILDLSNPAAVANFRNSTFFMGSDPENPYRLLPDLVNLSNYPPGVDDGNNAFLTPIIGTYDIDQDLDVMGLPRIIDPVNPLNLGNVDIGAYELSSPGPAEYIDDIGDFTVVGQEDTVLTFRIDQRVTGGFRPYTFEYTEPGIYDTDTTNICQGQPLRFDPETSTMTYCPPPDFFTTGAPPESQVSFTYRARGSLVTDPTPLATVTINLNPVDDGNPLSNSATQVVFIDSTSTTNHRLRPYVDFNPFRLSAPDPIPGQNPIGRDADYPFAFSNFQVDLGAAGYNPALFGLGANPTQGQVNTAIVNSIVDGYLQFQPVPGEEGIIEFTYTVTDFDGDTTSRRVKIVVTQRLAGIGLHDDTSLDFVYGPGWIPLYLESAINRTLHYTNTLDSFTDFYFAGDTFILTFLGAPAGANIEISVDPDAGTPNFQSPSALGLTCSTGIAPNGIVSAQRATVQYFSVGCSGLSEDYYDSYHILRIRNKSAGLFTWLDAVEIRGGATSAGYYEENDYAFTYTGTWTPLAIANGPKGGTSRYANSTTSTMTFSLDPRNASAFALYYTNVASWGGFSICSNTIGGFGGGCTQVTTNGLGQLWGRRAWITLGMLSMTGSPNVHTITIRPLANIFSGIEAIYIHAQPNPLGAPLAVDATPYEETAPNLTYVGNWIPWTYAPAYGGAGRLTTDASAAVMFNIAADARGVAVYRPAGTGWSNMQICITDLCQTFTSSGSLVMGSIALMRVTTPGPHVVEIRNTGTGTYFAIEAIRVLGNPGPLGLGYYEETEQATDFNLTYTGSWTNWIVAGTMGGTGRLTNSSSATASFQINASIVKRIVIYRSLAPGWSNFNVCASGGACTTIVNTASSFTPAVPAMITLANLGITGSSAVHTITITPTTNGAFAAIEALQLLGNVQPLGIGYYEETEQATNFNLTYDGPWSNWVVAGTMGGTGRLTNSTSATATFQVDVDVVKRIVIYRSVAPGWSNFRVCAQAGTIAPTCNTGGFIVTNTNPTFVTALPQVITLANLGIGGGEGVHTITIRPVTNAFAAIEALQLAGNPGPLAPGYYEETQRSTEFNLNYVGNWTNLTFNGPKGGTSRYTSSTASNANFTIDTSVVTGVAVYYTNITGYGGFSVCASNGGTCQNITITGAGQLWGRRAWFTLADLGIVGAPAIRTITITPLANVISGLEAIYIAGHPNNLGSPLAVSDTPYEETEPNLTYIGNWLPWNYAPAFGGAGRLTTDPSASVMFNIAASARGVAVYRPAGTGWSNMEICINQTCQTFTSAGTFAAGTLAVMRVSGAGPHVVEVRNLGNATYFAIEAIRVLGAADPLGPGYYEETEQASNFGITYVGNWTNLTFNGPKGGTSRYTNSTASNASFTIDTSVVTGVAVYYTNIASYGGFSVCASNGGTCQNITITGAGQLWGRRAWFTLADLGIIGAPAIRTITITPLANVISGLEAIYIAGHPNNLGSPLAVSDTPYEETEPNLTYIGNWLPWNYAPAFGGAGRLTTDPSASVMFNIAASARGVAVYRPTGSDWSNMEICINQTCQTFTSAGTFAAGTLAVMRVSGAGPHVVEVRNLGNATYFAIEAIRVLGAQQPLDIGYYEETEQATGFNLNYTGMWSNWVVAGTMGGTGRLTNSSDATATFQINVDTVKRIVIYRSQAPGWSNFRVCAQSGTTAPACTSGGVIVTNTNASFITALARIITLDELGIGGGSGVHTITIRPETNGAFAALEALQLLGNPGPLGIGYYEETEQATNYNLNYTGTWNNWVVTGTMGGTGRLTNSSDATATFQINVDSVRRIVIYRSQAPGWSNFRVCAQSGTTAPTCTSGGVEVVNTNPTFVTAVARMITVDELGIGGGSGVHTITIRPITNGAFAAIEALQLLGNPGPLAPGYYEETQTSTSFNLTYAGTWTNLVLNGPKGGSSRYSTASGSTATFTVDTSVASAIAVYYTNITGYGGFSVCASGGSCQNINVSGAGQLWGRRAWFTLADLGIVGAPAIRTITITSLTSAPSGLEALYIHAQPNPLGSPLAVSPTPYEETDPNLTYIGNWLPWNYAPAYGGAGRLSTDPSASVMFNIAANARGVAVYRPVGTGWSNMEICINQTCQTFTSAGTFTPGNLAVMRVVGAGPHVVEVRNVGNGTYFAIEAIRVLADSAPLTSGFYQQDDVDVSYTGAWLSSVSSSFSGGSSSYTVTPNAVMTFNITQATGFTIFTARFSGAAAMEICYRPTLPTVGSYVCSVENNNFATTQFTYGHTYFGLRDKQPAPNQALDQVYEVRVRHAGTAGQIMHVDAVYVLGTAPAPLTAGIYDDTHPNIVYGPAALWTTGASSAFSNGTFRYTNRAGVLAHLRITGNSLTIYQIVSAFNSNNIGICAVVSGLETNQTQCSNFSQNTGTTAYNIPITIYGLGTGTHEIIFENLSHGQNFWIDSIEVR